MREWEGKKRERGGEVRSWILHAHIYIVGGECEQECKIILNGEEMEEVNEFNYLGSVMCKHGGTEGETRERALLGLQRLWFHSLLSPLKR